MNDIAIDVESISKQYRLGTVGTGTLSHDLNRLWAKIRGQEDPFLKIGEVNDRTKKTNSNYVWALRDVNFSVNKGEVLGIIGRNGAGKSTLLKVLSQVTLPTQGKVKIFGRVGSLLEVGTGFHPELTGLENIYLNGAILGMKKWEIKKRLDEIVSFSGVERYLNTPVKRYSSGMKVRLGFSVAAHLDTEILIIDEVLAVGDADFQKSCISKMNEVSKQSNKTILLVSHNMSNISSLADRTLILDRGGVEYVGNTDKAITEYIGGVKSENLSIDDLKRSGLQNVKFVSVNFSKKIYGLFEELDLTLHLLSKIEKCVVNIGFSIHNSFDETIFQVYSKDVGHDLELKNPGEHELNIKLKDLNLSEGRYFLRLRLLVNGIEEDWPQGNAATFEVASFSNEYFFKDQFVNKTISLPEFKLR